MSRQVNLSREEQIRLEITCAFLTSHKALPNRKTLDDCIELVLDDAMKVTKSEPIPYDKILTYLNQVCNRSFRSTAKAKELIRARWNEGFRDQDFIKVINTKHLEWGHNPEMNKFLRPETLFGTKFDNYLNQSTPKNLLSIFEDNESEIGILDQRRD